MDLSCLLASGQGDKKNHEIVFAWSPERLLRTTILPALQSSMAQQIVFNTDARYITQNYFGRDQINNYYTSTQGPGIFPSSLSCVDDSSD